MESEWRWNIPYLGMSFSEWELAARSVEDQDLLLVQRKIAGIRNSSVWFAPNLDELPVRITPWAVRLEPFPYGEEVEPD